MKTEAERKEKVSYIWLERCAASSSLQNNVADIAPNSGHITYCLTPYLFIYVKHRIKFILNVLTFLVFLCYICRKDRFKNLYFNGDKTKFNFPLPVPKEIKKKKKKAKPWTNTYRFPKLYCYSYHIPFLSQ